MPAPQQGLQPGIPLQVFTVAGTKAGAGGTSGSFQGRARKGVDGGRGKGLAVPGSRLTASRRERGAGVRVGPRWAAPGYVMHTQGCHSPVDHGRRPSTERLSDSPKVTQ